LHAQRTTQSAKAQNVGTHSGKNTPQLWTQYPSSTMHVTKPLVKNPNDVQIWPDETTTIASLQLTSSEEGHWKVIGLLWLKQWPL